MSQPTTAIGFSPSTPAAPAGDQNAVPQTDGATPLQRVSFYPQRATSSLYGTVKQVVSTAGISIDGSGSPLTSGLKGTIQVNFAGTIIGWSLLADVPGSVAVDIWKIASSAPPSAPGIPTSANKISASAPVALSSAQSAAADSSGVSTWTTTAVAQWDVFGFSIPSSASGVTRLTLEIHVLRS